MPSKDNFAFSFLELFGKVVVGSLFLFAQLNGQVN